MGKAPTKYSLRLRNSGLVAVDFFDSDFEVYDSSSENYDPGDENEGIVVPSTTLNLSEEELEELRATVDPLSQSDDYGISLYQETLQFLHDIS